MACTKDRRYSDEGVGDQKPAEVHTQLGLEYMRKGMYEVSLKKFKEALKADPSSQVANTSIAILYEQLGESDEAARYYRKAYRLNKDDAVTLNNYGQFLCRKGDLDEANAMFMKAVKDPLYRSPHMVYTNAGICARQKPDLDLAEGYFRQALQRNPKYVPALQQMIRISFERENYLATRAYIQRLGEQEKLSPEYLWIGIRAEAELGNLDAMSSYSLFLKNEYPTSTQAQALQEWERDKSGR